MRTCWRSVNAHQSNVAKNAYVDFGLTSADEKMKQNSIPTFLDKTILFGIIFAFLFGHPKGTSLQDSGCNQLSTAVPAAVELGEVEAQREKQLGNGIDSRGP